MKKINADRMPITPMFALALMLNVLTINDGFGRNITISAAISDTTNAGKGTGSKGAGQGPSPVLLGKAGDFVILAKTGISNTGATAITGNIGSSPVAASYITGFSLLDPPSTYASSSLVTGKVYAADYDSPTPANLTVAVLDMETAYADAAARAPDYTELGAGNIGGKTLAPATYKWSTDLLIASDITLLGGAHDVWIFQVAGNLTQTSGVRIALKGGALPRNVYWQVAGASTHETTSNFEGVLLSKTAIILKTGATFHGRQLAQTAVVLDANVVKQSDMSSEPVTGTLSGSVKYPIFSSTSGKIHFVSMGEWLAVEMNPSTANRTLSVFGMAGALRLRIGVPAGQARTLIPSSLSPISGNRFQLK